MLDNSQTRSAVNKFVVPVARGLLKIGLSANHVTVLAPVLLSTVVLVLWPQGKFGLSLFIIVPLAFSDLLDGTMARLSESVSPWGSFLDSVMDRVTDSVMIIGLTLWMANQVNSRGIVLGVVALVIGLLIPYIRAKAESVGIECKVGILERAERTIVVLVGVLIAALGFTSGIEISLWLLVVLGGITVVQRLIAVSKAV